jgi:hypothetical protein
MSCRPVVQRRIPGTSNQVTLIFIMRTPHWSSGQSSWLQIQRSRFDPRLYQILWEVVGHAQDPLSLVSTNGELLGRKNSGFGLESRDYGRWDPSRWPSGTPYPEKLALTSPTSGGRSVGIVRSRTQATEFLKYHHIVESLINNLFANKYQSKPKINKKI